MDSTEDIDSKRLELTQVIRKDIITTLTKEGIPYDDKDRRFLLDTLNSMDHTSLTKMRIKVDDANKRNNEETVKAMAVFLLKISEKTLTAATTNRNIPSLDNTYKITNAVEGENSLGVINLSYDDLA